MTRPGEADMPGGVVHTLLRLDRGILATIFLYSGATKVSLSPSRLVSLGQTGVVGLPLPLIRFIAVAELLGVGGLLLPQVTGLAPWLTPLAALGLGTIMILAARVHLRRGEPRAVALTVFLLVLCLLQAWGSLP